MWCFVSTSTDAPGPLASGLYCLLTVPMWDHCSCFYCGKWRLPQVQLCIKPTFACVRFHARSARGNEQEEVYLHEFHLLEVCYVIFKKKNLSVKFIDIEKHDGGLLKWVPN